MLRKQIHLVAVILAVGFAQAALGALNDPNLIAWWAFNEGSGAIAADSGPLGLDGEVLFGAQWRTDGKRGGCLFFDGDNDYVLVPHDDALNPGTGSYTFTYWANIETAPGTSGTTDWDLPVAKRTGASNGYYVGASRAAGDSASETGYRFMLGNTSSSRVDTPYLSVPLGEWVFVAAVLDRDENIQKITVDGGLTWATNTPPVGTIAPTDDLGLGWDINQDNYWTHGRVDEVAFFNRALSDAEIGQLMDGGVVLEMAMQPSPIDQSTDVLTNVTLSWTAGKEISTHDVYFGTSFEDVNSASRVLPLGVLVSQGQQDTVYDPGILTYGQAYYWRIDEVGAAPNYTVYRGNVWSFTVEPIGYPIQGVVATTNGTAMLGQEIENIVNGSGLDANDLHAYSSTGMWLADPAADGTLWVQFEFDGVYKLYQALIWNYNVQFEPVLGFGVKNATVEYSENGVDWTALGDVDFGQGIGMDGYACNTIVDFDGAAVKYVKLTINSGFGTQGQYGLSEVRFLYIPVYASEPEPADGATDVSVESALSWRAGRGAVSHELYLGTDPATLPLVATVQDNVYETPDLYLGSTYYWQIVEVNQAAAISAWAGDVWTFSTQEYIVVDDFESYKGDAEAVAAGEAVWQTWLDGIENSANGGSQVGYNEGPFVEQTVVHGGSQSMPLLYDNSSASYAEAVRTFDTAQNWAANGVETLTLFFRGQEGNTGQLYAKINGVKVSYDGQATDLTKITWQQWNIDLASLGTNLISVQKLVVGIEGSGVSGTLLLDDIRLYRQAPIAQREPDSAYLVAYYALDGDATDSSGNGYDGAIQGNASFVDGVVGQALKCDGVDDFVRITNAPRLNPGTGSYSFTFWAQLDPAASASGTAVWDLAVNKRQTGSNGYYVGANRDQGGVDEAGYKFMVGNTSAARVDTGYLVVPVSEWVFVAAVLDRDQNVHKISVNGGASWSTATPPVGSINPSVDLAIAFDIGPNNYWFHGLIDEVRLYDKALTDAEVAWLANDL